MTQPFTIGIGEKKKLKGSMFGGSVDMIYCGMPNENTFSIGLLMATGYQGHGLNLFFPKRSIYVILEKKKYYVQSVTPEDITLQPSE